LASLDRVLQAAGAVALVVWVIGVSGRLGVGPTVNWALFLSGVGLVVAGGQAAGLLRRRSSAPAADRP
jgi:hypothetical protein